MDMFEPRGIGAAKFDPIHSGARIYQGGTFTANPITMAAGIETLKQLTPEVYGKLDALGSLLRTKLATLFKRFDAKWVVTGVGSLANLHSTPGTVSDYRSYSQTNSAELYWMFLSLMNEGILIAPRGMISLSTPMSELEIDAFLQTMESLLRPSV
jgi:glutamate-1-semialdehyde 2,1-aminomutase